MKRKSFDFKKMDGVELADKIKKGMSVKFMKDLDELRATLSRLH